MLILYPVIDTPYIYFETSTLKCYLRLTVWHMVALSSWLLLNWSRNFFLIWNL